MIKINNNKFMLLIGMISLLQSCNLKRGNGRTRVASESLSAAYKDSIRSAIDTLKWHKVSFRKERAIVHIKELSLVDLIAFVTHTEIIRMGY